MRLDRIIKGGNVVTPGGSFVGDVGICDEKIVALGVGLDPAPGTRVIDATGHHVLPGVLDVHVHLALPFCGTISADDYRTGTRAGARGGVTTVIDFAIPYAGESLEQAADNWMRKAEGEALVDYTFHICITRWQEHKSQIRGMVDRGFTTFKEFMIYESEGWQSDDRALFGTLEQMREHGTMLLVHAESPRVLDELIARHHTPELMKKYGARLHPMTRPNFVEAEAIQRAVQWCEVTRGQLYVVHMSTAEGADIVRAAQARGVPVLAETCAQYLVLDDSVFDGPDGHLFACCPQVKKPKDVERLWQGLRSGEVSVVSTDTCTFTREQKAMWNGDWTRIPMGLPGLETLLPLVYTRGVMGGRISLEELSLKLSTNPARIMGLYPRKGAIAVGSDADLVIVHPSATRKVEPRSMETNADWSPYEGWELAGFARTTLSRGEVIVDDYAVVGREGRGTVAPAHDGRAQRRVTTAAAEDLTTSPLWNPDLAPTPPERRTWSTWNIAALWIGMSVVITTYTLASGLMQQGMQWWQAMVTILLGNTIVLVPMVLNAHAGTRYGIPFPVLCRASFGVRGANLPAILRAIVACGWFGIQTWIGALALDALMLAAWSGWAGVPGHTAIAFAVFWLIQVAIIFKGTEGIKHLETWSAPVLLAGGALLLLWAVRNGGGLGHLLSESGRLQGGNASFWALFPSALTASVGYWATLSLNIPDFTRYARSQRSQMLGQALGLPTTMTAFAFIGVAVTSATIVVFGEAIWDPVVLIGRIGNAGVIVFGALVVLAAQLTTNMAANVVSPSNDFSNLSPKRISYVTGGLITAVIGVLMMPWRLYSDAAAYIFTWLIGYSSLMGALGGILIADYWIVRRQNLVLDDLYREQGVYTYRRGINPRAIVALVIAILPVIPGFMRAVATPGGAVADPTFFDRLYSYAWFVTFGISAVAYLGLMATGDRRQATG